MKVVIFCGGLGVRMGEETQRIPKPMVRIGNRPILWHIMRYYSAWGHTEFILCLGHNGEVIRDYFLRHDDAVATAFALSCGHRTPRVELRSADTANWRITFVDPGLDATIAERLKAVEPCIRDEESSLLPTETASPTLASTPSSTRRSDRGKVALFLSVQPQFNAHLVHATETARSSADGHSQSDIRINGGFFVFRREIIDYIEPGEELASRRSPG